MSEKDSQSKENVAVEVAPASPRVHGKREKAKYQAFRSDEDESSDDDESDSGRISRKRTFKVKIIGKAKKKVKEKDNENRDKDKQSKDKEKQEKKEKRKSKHGFLSGDEAEKIPDPPVHGPVFGVPLELAVQRSKLPDGISLPRIVRECIQYIEDKGLDCEGIYRISGVRSKMDQLRAAYNEGRKVSLEGQDPHVVASLLKLFLREMPSSVLTTRFQPIFEACVAIEDETEQVRRFQQLVNDLPVANRTLLAWLFVHFRHVMQRGSETKMNIQNLSIVFSPTMGVSHGVLNIFLSHIDQIFPDEEIIRYVKSKADDEPSTIEELEEALRKHEEVLAALHEKANEAKGQDEELSDELWDLQRKVTEIKRKIKALRREQATYAKSTEDISFGKPRKSSDKSRDSLQADPSVVTDASAVDSDRVKVEVRHPGDVARHSDASLEPDSPRRKDQKPSKARAPRPPQDRTWVAEVVATRTEGNPAAPAITQVTQEPVRQVEEGATATTNDSVAATTKESEFDSETDEEMKALHFEEKKLLIEQEELLRIGENLRMKISIERAEVERLEMQLQLYEQEKIASSSSSISSLNSSSSSSVVVKGEDSASESDDDNMELERIIMELEEEHGRLEAESWEKIKLISQGRFEVAKLRTELRILQGGYGEP